MKKPMLLDFVFGVQGAFMGTVDDDDKNGKKFIMYRPLNSFRTYRYPCSLDENMISDPINLGNNGTPGVPEYVVVIMNDDPDRKCVMDRIDVKLGKKMAILSKERSQAEYARKIAERASKVKEKEEEDRKKSIFKDYRTERDYTHRGPERAFRDGLEGI